MEGGSGTAVPEAVSTDQIAIATWIVPEPVISPAGVRGALRRVRC